MTALDRINKWRKQKRHNQPGQLVLPLPHLNPLRKHDQMGTFEDILNRPADDIKPPPQLPVGTYHTILVGLPERGKSSKKQTDFFKFIHKIVAPLDDVDTEALAEIEGGVIGKEVDNTFYITEKSAFMLKDFLINCGIEVEGKSLAACIDETPNREVLIHIKHEASDNARIFAKVGYTAPVE